MEYKLKSSEENNMKSDHSTFALSILLSVSKSMEGPEHDI